MAVSFPLADMQVEREQQELCRLVLALRNRFEIDELLARCFDLRSTEGTDGVEYGGTAIRGWLRVRYRNDRAVAAYFVDSP